MGSFMKGMTGKPMPKVGMGQIGGANLPAAAGMEGSPTVPYGGIESQPQSPSLGYKLGRGFASLGQSPESRQQDQLIALIRAIQNRNLY